MSFIHAKSWKYTFLKTPRIPEERIFDPQNPDGFLAFPNPKEVKQVSRKLETQSASRIRRSGVRKMLRERIGVWEEDSIYWVKKSPSFDEKKVPWLFMKNHAFSPLCRVLEKENFGRGQKVFFCQTRKFFDQVALKNEGDFHIFIFTTVWAETKRVKKFFQYTTCVYEVVSPRLI